MAQNEPTGPDEPQESTPGTWSYSSTTTAEGISLRDWFAGMALAARETTLEENAGSIAFGVYRIADAMLAEAAKGKGTSPDPNDWPLGADFDPVLEPSFLPLRGSESGPNVLASVIMHMRKKAEEECNASVAIALRHIANDFQGALKATDLPDGEPPLCLRTFAVIANRLEATENHHTSAASFIRDWAHELRQEARANG